MTYNNQLLLSYWSVLTNKWYTSRRCYREHLITKFHRSLPNTCTYIEMGKKQCIFIYRHEPSYPPSFIAFTWAVLQLKMFLFVVRVIIRIRKKLTKVILMQLKLYD